MKNTYPAWQLSDFLILVFAITVSFNIGQYFISSFSYIIEAYNWVLQLTFLSIVFYSFTQLHQDTFYKNYKSGFFILLIFVTTFMVVKIILYNFFDPNLKEMFIENKILEIRQQDINFEKSHKGLDVSFNEALERENIEREFSAFFLFVEFISRLFFNAIYLLIITLVYYFAFKRLNL